MVDDRWGCSMQEQNGCIQLGDILEITEKLNHNKDIDSLLDHILLEARINTGADAGSIFLAEKGVLTFSYVQNDTMAKREKNNNKYIYSSLTIPIDEKSIAGYVALTGKPLNIPDAYAITPDKPYRFNTSFDQRSDYRTKAILAVPLTTSQGKIVGVMQIINPADAHGTVTAFSEIHEQFVNFFAGNASVAIERALMTRENILRMVRMSGLRDPKETGAHVNRVGSYAIEIYEGWAEMKGLPVVQKRKFKDILRIAAMLHDVGKVAISDTILKKPAKLDDDEYKVMKTHAKQGADLFDPDLSELDALCHDIALGHHEKWDGTGYPRSLKGDTIPLAARITAIADVYDALISRRAYKEGWKEEEVITFLKENSGSHFDPELVEAFLNVYEVISAIRTKYPDAEN